MTTIDATVLKQALDALLGYKPHSLTHAKEQGSAIIALREAIAQPVPIEGDAKDTELLDFINAAAGTIRSDVPFAIFPKYIHWGEGKTMREAIRAAIASQKAKP